LDLRAELLMGLAALSGVCGSIAKVAVLIAMLAVSLAVPAYAAAGVGGRPIMPAPLDNPTGPDAPACGLDPANIDPVNSPCRYDDDGIDFGYGGIADTGISAGGVSDTGVGIGDSGVGGIP
jgi:hypothetical protein